ncbi:MAG: hypothetical protein U0L49_02285 [Eubacterium sp.]|nr:hypothetical protein [Eubacterium sp.]
MNTVFEENESIDFSKAVRNPFAKIAREARDNNGDMSPERTRKMMREAIAELKSQEEQNAS